MKTLTVDTSLMRTHLHVQVNYMYPPTHLSRTASLSPSLPPSLPPSLILMSFLKKFPKNSRNRQPDFLREASGQIFSHAAFQIFHVVQHHGRKLV